MRHLMRHIARVLDFKEQSPYGDEAMKPLSSFQSAIAWLCLICFGISALFAGALVFCTDSQGTRLELECLRNQAGECLTTAANLPVDKSSGDGAQARAGNPCVESSASVDMDLVTVADGKVSTQPLLPDHVFVAVLIGWVPVRETPRVQPIQADHPRPPDAVEHLGTVVLLV